MDCDAYELNAIAVTATHVKYNLLHNAEVTHTPRRANILREALIKMCRLGPSVDSLQIFCISYMAN